MRVAALIPLLGFFCNLALAVFVLSRGTKNEANRVYFFLAVCIAIWNLGQYFLFVTDNPADALFWVRFLWFGVTFIPTLLFHLSMLLAEVKVGKLLHWLYGCLAALAGTVPTEFFIKGIRDNGTSGWYAIGAPGLFISSTFFGLMFVAIFILNRKRKQLRPMQRSRLTALIYAQTMLSILGTNDILPIIGFDNYPLTHIKVYPYGNVAAVLYGVIVAYSVLQHHLLDVQIRLSGVAAQLVRVTFVTIGALSLLLLTALMVPGLFTMPSLLTAMAVFVVSTIGATLVFPRLFGGDGVERWERRILGDHFEYQDRIRAFIKTVPLHSDLQTLLGDVDELLTGTFHFSRHWLILRDEPQLSFVLASANPPQPQVPVPELRVPSPLSAHFEQRRLTYLALGATSLSPSLGSPERQARDQLGRFEAEFAFPLIVEGNLFGLLLVGTKRNDEMLTATDLHLLVELTQQLSLVLNQIRLKDEVLRTQELELLGRMSRGMAHDLNNLLTPIWTLLQLANEGMTREALDDELLDVALRNIKTVRAYIREALFFSQHLRPDLQLGRLDVVVHQAVEVAQANRKKDVEIIATTPGEVLVEMDEVLVQRLLANLISNAMDATPLRSQIRVELERLGKAEASREWMRIRVIDQGEGIPKENLERVLTPYFTTKNRGDGARGFGLGLAICRKIVALHGGKLSISSELRKGTTVQIDLPSRQVQVSDPEVAHAA